jgi:hypothetical protein
MKIEGIYSPLYVNNILDTNLLKALHETDEKENALMKLDARMDPMQSPMQSLKEDQVRADRSSLTYDMNGGIRDDGSHTSGTRVDTYV